MEYINGDNKITILNKEGEYAIIKRNTEFNPFIVAYKFKVNLQEKTCEWDQGYYCKSFDEALDILCKKFDYPEKYKFEVGETVIVKQGSHKRIAKIIGRTNFESAIGRVNQYAIKWIQSNYGVYVYENDLLKANEKNLLNDETKPKAKLATKEKVSNHQGLRR